MLDDRFASSSPAHEPEASARDASTLADASGSRVKRAASSFRALFGPSSFRAWSQRKKSCVLFSGRYLGPAAKAITQTVDDKDVLTEVPFGPGAFSGSFRVLGRPLFLVPLFGSRATPRLDSCSTLARIILERCYPIRSASSLPNGNVGQHKTSFLGKWRTNLVAANREDASWGQWHSRQESIPTAFGDKSSPGE